MPYPLTRQYFIVKEGDARDMVLVPVTTAFELLGLILHVLSAGVKEPLWGWVRGFYNPAPSWATPSGPC